ncbi:MAG: winged helix DNA-binding domain-containing protein, partial [Actinomycetota bacterium]|nr:winged helix DNA-binding domain-containing protein [Actinomycetota bacterium]
RGGADYIVPRKDVGVFTLGSYPRDEDVAADLERLADEIQRVTKGEMRPVGEVQSRVAADKPIRLKRTAVTGRVHIRWDASRIWLIPAERPKLDVEDARRELARRFLHWFGPTTVQQLARWTGVDARDAKETWAQLEAELAEVDVDGRRGFLLAADLEAVERAPAVTGVRLLPIDDPFTKFDHDLLVPDEAERRRVLPRAGESPGYAPGAVLVDGEIVGAWQRQERRVRIHPFARLSPHARNSIDKEALSFPIAGSLAPTVTWEER